MTDIVKPNPTLRFFQVFSARLVLEVFGGGGAIWGFSEALTLRYPETQEFWRQVAAFVGAAFFFRWILQMKDYFKDIKGNPNPVYKNHSGMRCLQVFTAKMILEVWGGAGAIWGFSEAMSLRRPDTQEYYRFYALTVGLFFLNRLVLQVHDFFKGPDYSPEIGENKWVRFMQIFTARIVLEVMGGAGAIWGFSEVCTLRRPETQELWRLIALTVGFIFFLRFLCQHKDYFMEMKLADGSPAMTDGKWIRLMQIFWAKIVLEVFGAGGAIWGFSEAMSLRRPETQEFYRVFAVTVGGIFLLRHMCQVRDYVYDIAEEDIANPGKGKTKFSYSVVNHEDEVSA
jgi:hypothetical protein